MRQILDIHEAAGRLIAQLYADQPEPDESFNYRTPSKQERNRAIHERYALGQSVPHLALIFQISEQRVRQILQEDNGQFLE